MSLITDLENHEADPDQLSHLFQLDHLATRMRRNGENLLVLAGEEPGRRWMQPVPLVDVLRAAAAEVESYERIEMHGVPETEIHGAAVTDLVHLLAELLENATSFSSPQTKVKVTATRLPDGRIVVEIHDKGIGLTAEDFADINHKLADPLTVDAVVSRRMGLFVVGRLADRHDIRVQLRPSGEAAGTTSLVTLPEPITHGGGDEAAEDDFTVSRIVPEHHGGAGEPAQLTAAELGFDDRPYENPGAAQALDPVGGPYPREGHRAALGATAGAPASSGSDQSLFGGENAADGRYEQSYDHSYDGSGRPIDPTPWPQVVPQGPADPSHQPGQAAPPPADQGRGQAEYFPPVAVGDPPQWDRSASRDTWQARPAPFAAGPGPLPGGPKRVGYDPPDGGPGGPAALTDAGLPRRDRPRATPGPTTGRNSSRRNREAMKPPRGGPRTTNSGSGPNRSASRRRAESPPPACPGGYPGEPGPRCRTADSADRSTGLSRPGGHPRQVEQPAPRRPAGTWGTGRRNRWVFLPD